MEFDLCPSVTLQTGTYSAVIAPVDTVTGALNANLELQRFMFLYVCGNFSRIMSGVNRNSVNFEIRRAFTAFQLLTILSEAYHTVILVEHDPDLYEGTDQGMMLAQVTRALKAAARDAMVILFTPSADRTFHSLAKQADRVFHLAVPESKLLPAFSPRSNRKYGRGQESENQMTLEAFYGKNNCQQQIDREESCGTVVADRHDPQERQPEVWGGTRKDGATARQRGILRV